MNRRKVWQVINVLAFALVITFNGLANAIPFNGQTTGEVSARYDNLFVPAGFTFSIWGVIYLLLLAFVIYQARDLFRRPAGAPREYDVVGRVGPWFLLSCLANAAWLPAWHYELMPLSMLIMLLLLFSLIMLYRRLGIGREPVSTSVRLAVHAPFSVYLGWISVATIANTAALLTGLGWDGSPLPAPAWAAVVITVATGLGIWMLWRQADIAYALVLLWAFYGILSQRARAPEEPYPLMTVALIGGAVLLVLLALARMRPLRVDR